MMKKRNELETIVKFENINKIYNGNEHVLYDLNLEFKEGTFNAIIGESGTGKSTILNILGTLDQPTDGNVIINGQDTKSMTSTELASFRNRELGFIFQTHYLLPEFSVWENVLIPHLINNVELTSDVEKFAENLMKRVKIFEIKDKNVLDLSVGQKQRVAIARALLNKPSIILADEPAASLDNKLSKTVFELLKELNKYYGITFIIISHNPQVKDVADRVIELHDGRIISDSGY